MFYVIQIGVLKAENESDLQRYFWKLYMNANKCVYRRNVDAEKSKLMTTAKEPVECKLKQKTT